MCGSPDRPFQPGSTSAPTSDRMTSLSPTEFRVPPVDAIALETRAAELATRSIKTSANA